MPEKIFNPKDLDVWLRSKFLVAINAFTFSVFDPDALDNVVNYSLRNLNVKPCLRDQTENTQATLKKNTGADKP